MTTTTGTISTTYHFAVLFPIPIQSVKEPAATTLLEPFILFFVLFFRGTIVPGAIVPGANAGATASGAAAVEAAFSAPAELNRLLIYTIPSLALLWYLAIAKKSLPSPAAPLKPTRRDIYPFLTGLPGLLLIGISLAHIMTHTPGLPPPPRAAAPTSTPGWIIMAFSCLGTGYLEETYFRHYLLTRLSTTPLAFRLTVSITLFAICHAYEGPWGILNAALAGTLLALLYEHHHSLHGIASAHAAYNASVYLMSALIK
jgi:membrane protease YdiL (CAAX protease family)